MKQMFECELDFKKNYLEDAECKLRYLPYLLVWSVSIQKQKDQYHDKKSIKAL